MKSHLLPISNYAVAISAASSRPISWMEISHILYFWVLPLMVMGKESTNFTYKSSPTLLGVGCIQGVN